MTGVDVTSYLDALNGKVQKLAFALHDVFVGRGCSAYVKTIYVGYDFEGEMVAALYGHADHVEVAIALDERHQATILVDASHLTWRTLPVAAIIRNDTDLAEAKILISEACERVLAGKHSVYRDNEFFAKSRRERRSPH